MLLLAYATGMRRAELAAATTGDLTRKALDGALEDAYVLRVDGKGRRQRKVPMPAKLLDLLRADLRARAEPLALETAPADTPLVAHQVTGASLHPNTIGTLFKRIFARAADLQRASTHWLRHTFANHGLDVGADIRRPKQSCHRLRSKNVTSRVGIDWETENYRKFMSLSVAQ
ncbi:tyrosine-type recombinase/integrase [Burkholderia gladioli]|uniref:tyrosine-type recombinase/integrase n=1 Tax=Burkholderia gladioli TaxID=28095 RepID=UPI001FC84A0F